jgi:RND family efflux transporter MFP subunit
MSESGSLSRKLLTGGLLTAVVALLLFGVFGSRQQKVHEEQLTRQAAVKSGPRVPVVVAALSTAERKVTLSGEARPYAEVTLYAKVSGYLREIRVDKGERVRSGQLLARIESPELDRQYDAALADARNKRLFADRLKPLLKDGAIARQDFDNADSAARSAEAVAEGLKVQKGYEIMRAPFSGVVTVRYVDPGALLQSATSNQTASQPVVTVSRIDRLRVHVYLDQKNAPFVRVGDRAEVTDPARPEVRLPLAVSRLSGELDPKSRTLLVELELDNREGKILAGGFVQVVLALKTPARLRVPAEALLVRGEKSYVGVVGSDSRVSFRPVTVADSDGSMVWLSAGLRQGERVILNPGTGITEGELVQPISAAGK